MHRILVACFMAIGLTAATSCRDAEKPLPPPSPSGQPQAVESGDATPETAPANP